MRKSKESIDVYALRLLKKKNYFIKELYLKLIDRYNQEEVNKLIKKFILLEIINDKYLAEMKICYFIHIKCYGPNYILNYFKEKSISTNLVNYILKKYNEKTFLSNLDDIRNKLREKGKNDYYIDNYLLRKGYTLEQIKRYVS